MFQHRYTPGRKSKTAKLIYYTAILNAQNPNNNIVCECIEDKYDKFVSQSNTSNVSNNTRTSQQIHSVKGGSVQFGNFYLGEPLVLNYLGQIGNVKPPKNNF